MGVAVGERREEQDKRRVPFLRWHTELGLNIAERPTEHKASAALARYAW